MGRLTLHNLGVSVTMGRRNPKKSLLIKVSHPIVVYILVMFEKLCLNTLIPCVGPKNKSGKIFFKSVDV